MKIKNVFRKGNLMGCRATSEESSVSEPKTAPRLIQEQLSSASFNLREEYANAFRTESYIEFWIRALNLTTSSSSSNNNNSPRTAAARLPSYRLFAEHLLDPDQPTVTKILSQNCPPGTNHHSLLSDYFTKTANASMLCGHLLKDIERTRLYYNPLKAMLQGSSSPDLPAILDKLISFSKTLNPFGSSATRRFNAVQSSCGSLLKQLELSREKARGRLRFFKRFKHGFAVFLVVVTLSATVVAIFFVAHVVVALIGLPAFLSNWRLDLTSRLARVSAQLDAAAKGTYILKRDFDTISRLVERLHDELEHVRAIVRFCLERREDHLQPLREVVRQLRKNESSFSQQLDELEEHLYLCFMTINRARSLVTKEILEMSQVNS